MKHIILPHAVLLAFLALPTIIYAEVNVGNSGVTTGKSSQETIDEIQRKTFGFVPASAAVRGYQGPQNAMPDAEVIRKTYGFIPASAAERGYQGPQDAMPDAEVIRKTYGFIPASAAERGYQGPQDAMPDAEVIRKTYGFIPASAAERGYQGPQDAMPDAEVIRKTYGFIPASAAERGYQGPQDAMPDAEVIRKTYGFMPASAAERGYEGPHETMPPGDITGGVVVDSKVTNQQVVTPTQTSSLAASGVKWPSGDEAFSPSRVSPLGFDVCNAVAYANHPDLGLTLIGREPALGGCDDSKGWSLTVAQLDWNTKTVTKIKTLFDGLKGAWTADRKWFVSTAYDPTIEKINGEFWLAFECGLSRTEGGPFEGTGSSCAAPLVSRGQGYELDTNRLSVLVHGDRDPVTGVLMSASVPKLVEFKGELLLFWTAVDVRPFGSFGQLTTRAVRLELKDGLLRVAGANPTILSMQAPSVEVLGPSNGSPFGLTADLFQVMVVGDSLVATGAASDLCTVPKAVDGCYQVFFSQTSTPLAPGAFGKNVMPFNGLPENAQQYLRFLRGPDGDTYLMGHFPFKGSRSDLIDGVIVRWPERWR